MLIKTTVRTAKVKTEKLKEVVDLVSHDHHIAWETSADKKINLKGSETHFGDTGLKPYYTYSIDKKGDEKSLHEYLLLGQTGFKYAAKAFPEAMDKPLDAMSLLVDSSDAFQKWTDPTSTRVESSLATGKAVLSAFDVFEPYFPLLQQYSAHVKVAGLLLKVADSVYVVQKEYEYKTSSMR
jgi:hypothetical protein